MKSLQLVYLSLVFVGALSLLGGIIGFAIAESAKDQLFYNYIIIGGIVALGGIIGLLVDHFRTRGK